MKTAISAALIVWIMVIVSTCIATAHDMSDPDGAWYQSLVVPGAPGTPMAGSSCCNGGAARDADCKNVEVRQTRGADGVVHWEAWIDSKTFPESKFSPIYGHAPNAWVVVPDNVIIRGINNPTGGFVACFYNSTIRCFVEGTQT